jgi:exodeoxyribonuclease VII large subunit
LRRALETRAQRLDALARRLLTPAQKLARDRDRVAQYRRRLARALPEVHRAQRELLRLRERLAVAQSRGLAERLRRLGASRNALTHLDPTQVLARGYSIVRDAGGHVRRSSRGLAPGQALDVTFSEGGAAVRVEEPR